MSLLTLGTLGGRWLGGFLMDYLNARLVFVLGASLYFVSSYLAIGSHSDTLNLAYVASALQGIAYGWTYSCTNTMIGHYYGPKAYPKLSGMYIFLTSSFASPAGYVGGKIFDVYRKLREVVRAECRAGYRRDPGHRFRRHARARAKPFP